MAHTRTTHLHERLYVDETSPSGLRRKSGKVAGSKRVDGYWHVQVDGKKIYAHVAVMLLSGIEKPDPGCEVDHIDKDPSNNKLSNLRWVSKAVNCRRKRTENKLGYTYVFREHRIEDGYRYKFRSSGRLITGPIFATPAKAHTAALAHRLELFWNP